MNNKVLLAVNGTLMRGLELENNLKEVGASFIKESQTENGYRLFTVDDKYPAMVKDELGAAIDVEVYELSEKAMEVVLSKEPEGLTIKRIKLIDGQIVYGVMGLPFIIKGRKEITPYGGWRNYIKEIKK
ncbi:MAG: gamma-glutamylcyclotransferase [Bacilli bacterium]|nr:gamma-glutamylcyclotransferase [Bacilli bacterium]